MTQYTGRLLACAIALGVSAGALADVAPTLHKVKDSGSITIAYRESSIPFSYLDDNKKPVGYAIDLCLRVVEAVKKELKMPGLKVEWIPVTGATRIPAIVEGKADLECGSTTNNADRRKLVAFTIPHYVAGAKLLVRTKSGIKGLDDLRGKTVVTSKGTTTVKLLDTADQSRVLKLTKIEAKDHAESFKFVEDGKADAFAMDDVLLYSLRSSSKNPEDFAVVGEFMSVEPLAIMVRKDDPDFKKLVDATIARIITDFEINKIYHKWFLEPIPPKGVNLNIPMNYLLRDSFKYPTDKVGDS